MFYKEEDKGRHVDVNVPTKGAIVPAMWLTPSLKAFTKLDL